MSLAARVEREFFLPAAGGKGRKKKKQETQWFQGKVVSYDESSELYSVLYEDGDQEEMDREELESVLRSNRTDSRRQQGSLPPCGDTRIAAIRRRRRRRRRRP
jgi:hypothetical protein